jgi:lipid-binding SYLF domain-containing protein
MSVNKLGIILLSSFLIFSTAPAALAQSSAPTQGQTSKSTTTTHEQTTKKQVTKEKGAASKDEIRKAQQALKDKGLYNGPVDGSINAETQKALREFQQKNSLKVTGTLDHETMTALGVTSEHPSTTGRTGKSETRSSETTTTTKSETKATTSTKSGTAGETPKRQKGAHKPASGVSKDKVREIQAALKKEGFDPGRIDGVLGSRTMTALRNYQSHNGLEVTGTINAETENALVAAGTGARRSKPGKTKSESYSSQSRRESVGVSSSGVSSNPDDVRQVQQQLAELQYNPGDANGMMTAQTRQAIREFQFLNNLPVTGNLDEQTIIAMDIQAGGGIESAQSGKTYSSTVEREKPGISAKEQTQTRTERSTTTSSSVQSSSPSAQGKDKTSDTSRDTKADKKDKDRVGKSDKDAAHRVEKAADVLLDLTSARDKRIPNELLERAEAIAVIPNMIKGAFGIGGRYGKGVVSQRLENGQWSPPAFLQISGGSFGAQLGVTNTDLVLVFTDRKALDTLMNGKDLKLGVDAGVAAGPIGRSAEAGVNLKLDTAIYAYSRSKGLFAGVALDGAVLDVDGDTNRKVYGSSVDAKDILNGKMAANATVRPFLDALDKVAPKKRISQK